MDSWPAPSPAAPPLPGRGLPLRVYDTSTREVRPLAPGPVARVYVCGITPYDATHLGHAATYLTYDLMVRQLLDAGHEVRYVQNVTDVDDPLLERAAATGVDWRELARRETDLFRADMMSLRVLPPDHYVGAVEAIPQIAELVVRLRDAGAAYDVDGDVYFSVAAAPRFGEVGHFSAAEMLRLAADNGGDPDRPGKKDPLDPLLWRAARDGEPSWDSPLGPGRPGWHVECAAIAMEYLGPTLDVQGGGADLVFPHHECSAAHAEVASGVWPFARAYVHSALVGLDGTKMSKSLGNLVLVSRLRAAGVDPAAVRLAVLSQHYRQPWEWTDGLVREAQDRLLRWAEAMGRPQGPPAQRLLEEVRARLADDLDAPRALAAVDRWAADAVRAGGRDPDGPALARATADALLGVAVPALEDAAVPAR